MGQAPSLISVGVSNGDFVLHRPERGRCVCRRPMALRMRFSTHCMGRKLLTLKTLVRRRRATCRRSWAPS